MTKEPPAHLKLLEDFVNTIELDGDTDELADPGGLVGWFVERGFELSSPDDRDVRKAIEVREAIRALMSANNGDSLDARATELLNAAAENAVMRLQISPDGRGALQPAASGIDAALALVLAAMFQSMADGSWPNMKACRSDTCRWAFHDSSKNHSRTWCSMSVCGNRAKARSYRERHDA